MKSTLTIFIILSCGYLYSQYIPSKKIDMSFGTYHKYKNRLDTAYMNKDSFEIGISLANLEANADSVFYYFDRGILQNTTNCDRVYHFYNLFKQYNFIVNVVRIDSFKFENSFNLCQLKIGKSGYNNYLEKKQKDYENKIKKRPKLDSTKFDLKLIKELDQIIIDDQETRKKMTSKILNERGEEYKRLMSIQLKFDSINLAKVEKIIEVHGFPSDEKINYNHGETILLVLHHQGDLEIRKKYLPLLEQAVIEGKLSKGWLEIYKQRNEFIALDKD